MTNKSRHSEEAWLYEISSKRKLIDLNFKEIWRYRDLLTLFVRRDIVATYKQTILGPLWYLIQPLFTSVIFTLVFNNLGNIQTGGVPPFLFNLAGITAWNYFKQSLTSTAGTFRANAGMFGKVYFPRVIVPLSKVTSNLFKFSIQFLIFLFFFGYYRYSGAEISFGPTIWLFPVYILIMAMFGLGVGMLISSLTTKYRDFSVLLGFAVNLLMYLSAVPYPLNEAREKLPDIAVDFVVYNPLAQLIEGFRYMLLNTGDFSWNGFAYVLVLSVGLFLLGLIVFNRTEKNFIDTV